MCNGSGSHRLQITSAVMAEVLRLLSDAYNELITTGSVDVALIKLLISKVRLTE